MENGANVCVISNGRTITLHICAHSTNKVIIRMLVNAGVDVNAIDREVRLC